MLASPFKACNPPSTKNMSNQPVTIMSIVSCKIVESPPVHQKSGCRDGITHIGATYVPPFPKNMKNMSKSLSSLRLPGSCKPCTLTNTTLPYPLPSPPKRLYLPHRWGVFERRFSGPGGAF
jgi:hypothetical protein